MSIFRDMFAHKTVMVEEKDALPGRDEIIGISGIHYVNGHNMKPPFPDGMNVAYFALGCFWGAERFFWQLDGVYVTASGYQGGYTKNPTYEEVCTARTGHAEAVMVVFDPSVISYKQLVTKYFEAHNPTQYMGQGNDIGTEYRSAIWPIDDEQYEVAREVKSIYAADLSDAGYGDIATEIHDVPAPPFYYAEEYHQQYLGKNPNGYCGLRGTGVSCAIDG